MKEKEIRSHYFEAVKSYLKMEGADFLEKVLDPDYQQNYLYRHPLFSFFTTHFDHFEFVTESSDNLCRSKHKIVFDALIQAAEELKKELDNE